MGLTSPIGRTATATAPVRVADVGGWTDTWFGSPGQVCSLAVGPGVTATVTVVEGAGEVRLVAPDVGADLTLAPTSPHGPWLAGQHPLLEHAVASVLAADGVLDLEAMGFGLEVRVTSAVPAGASLGTSASVLVALVAALDAVVDRRRTPDEIAVAAHQVETGPAGHEAGVQDQWAAALGGCSLLAIGPYPEVRHRSVPLDRATLEEIGERMVTVCFGPHDSSAVHAQVINDIVGCGGVEHDRTRAALRRLGTLAGEAARALGEGDVDEWARVLIAATDAQALLHPALVGSAHRAAIDVARPHGLQGWKVNGAGGDGGSLTLIAADAASGQQVRAALRAADPTWRVVDLAPASGLAVQVTDPG